MTETDCKMSSGKTEAERKFWRIPELVETLLPFLDVKSILSLAQCHQLTLNILQGTFVWNQLIQRTFGEHVQIVGYDPMQWSMVNGRWSRVSVLNGEPWRFSSLESLAPERLQLVHLVDILKMLEDPNAHLKALLDLVCERFLPNQDGPRQQTLVNDWGSRYKPHLVQVTCSRFQTHTVSPLGYILLQQVEKAFFGSTEHKIEEMVMVGENGRREDLRKMWEALPLPLEPGDCLDVESICGSSWTSFYRTDGEEDFRRLVEELMDIEDIYCGCGGQKAILTRRRP